MPQTTRKKEPVCYHCGDDCTSENIKIEDKTFCCNGCKTVYEILSSSDLCDYYAIENSPGISMKSKSESRFEYLENESVIDSLLDYKDANIAIINFYLPQIHCSACLWLLENLTQLNPSIQHSRVNFLKKEINIDFKHNDFSLRMLVELLTSLGYEPTITMDKLEGQKKQISRRLIYQLGLAGFTFGNIMLLSLPEYFGLDAESFIEFSPWFGWINLALASPTAFYSGQDYFKSAWKSLKRKQLNIDVPIALGVLVLYIRSTYEVVMSAGAGYFDSLCGLLFFLLLGRIFQERIYYQLSFERDYRSYFPISVSRINGNKQESIPINELVKGDVIFIRNQELIPVDAELIKGVAKIDNSYVTGESIPIEHSINSKIYAGGKQLGESIYLKVIRPFDQSKLSRIWTNSKKAEEHTSFSKMTDKVSSWFTPIILLVTLIAGIYHFQHGIGSAVEVMSAVLIVACPCALALAAPFTFGHSIRWMGLRSCFLRDANVVEKLAKVNHLVFDKTGTLTYNKNQEVIYSGQELTNNEKNALWNLLNQSNHPLSLILKNTIQENEILALESFSEIAGKGIKGQISNKSYKIGSSKWLNIPDIKEENTSVYIEIENEIKGKFAIENNYRVGLKGLFNKLKLNYMLSLISGDNDTQRDKLQLLFPVKSKLLFNQDPGEKLHFIEYLQAKGNSVMMIGDGLNDAAALNKADVGLAIAEDVNTFSPACDIILKAEQFTYIPYLLKFAKQSKNIVMVSFVISFMYNIVGLSLAIQGLLSPVIAAILMPLSSISVVAFVSLAVWIIAKKTPQIIVENNH